MHARTRLASLALVAGSTVAVTTVTSPPAHAICDVDALVVTHTTKGAKVWIPSSGFPAGKDWIQGGSVAITHGWGKMQAKTKGSSDTVGGGGSLDLPLGSVSAKYDRQWNRSTTTTTSSNTSWTKTLSARGKWRPRLYAEGFKFTATYRVTYLGGCESRTFKRTVVLPKKKAGWLLGKEKYKNRGKLQAR